MAGGKRYKAAVRVREVLKWGKSDQYKRLKRGLAQRKIESSECPECSAAIEGRWRYCRHCGAKLK